MIHAAALTLTICLLLSMDDNVNKMNIKQELSQAREAVLQRLNVRGCITILMKFLTDLVVPCLESWIADATILLIIDSQESEGHVLNKK